VAALSWPDSRFAAPEALFRSPPLSLIPTADRLLALAVIASVLLHAMPLALTFTSGGKPRASAPQPLEVVLVNARTTQAPVKADVLAQSNLDGGGNTDLPRRAKTPLPQSSTGVDVPDQAAAARAQVARLEAETQRLLAQLKSTVPIETREAVPGPQPLPPSQTVTAADSADLAARSLEMARLRAQLSQSFDAYQQRPRRAFVGARAQEFRFARYAEDWRAKIERVGNLNYPDEARRQKLYGTLLLSVSIRRDGSIDAITINRSSGFKLLDQAAIRIVELAAPFAAFPPDIAKDTDIVEITRTWSFTSADQFQGQ
jgi:periplasmic protein TonB